MRKGQKQKEKSRELIRTAMILNRLHGCVEGKNKMEPHQVAAALGLLKKRIPDLKAIHTTMASDQTFEEWLDGIPSPKGDDGR